MNRFKLILCVGAVLMSGCATPTQNAALIGAIGGAVIATELNQPRPVLVVPPVPGPSPATPISLATMPMGVQSINKYAAKYWS